MNQESLTTMLAILFLVVSCKSSPNKHEDDHIGSDTVTAEIEVAEGIEADLSDFDSWLTAFRDDLKHEEKGLRHFEFPVAQAGFTNSMMDKSQLISSHFMDFTRDQFNNPNAVRIHHYDGTYLHSFLYESIGNILKDTALVRVIEVQPEPIGSMIYVRKTGDTWKVVGYEVLTIAD